ncbi:cell wall hydrolase [Sphingomonas flavescens]|uniref:cell wall hydrolase n=1 Tax=Sphingomonas flavescens TaxID=3132797 RepID=UPI002803EA2C|nr:cell wall hydrolase [Sphingomonas limnosediminicola]
MRWRKPLVVTTSLVAVAFVGWTIYLTLSSLGDSGARSTSRTDLPPAAAAQAVVGLPPPDLVRPITPEEAARENAERPFVNRPDSAARKFVLKVAADEADRALTCLTQAVYYEAAGEGTDGGRAVAQIVLNRMRHPGYPASVCGVIYQGSERATGCQFTFTCDGSLLRPPAAALWNRSRKIAQEALAGKVFAPVGHATHYHADYVVPYWADSLDKTVQIGRHIFYRLRGAYGDGNAFSQRYAGHEPLLPPKPDESLVSTPPTVPEDLASTLMDDGVTSGIKDVEKAAPVPVSPLVADTNTSTLLLGGPAPTSAAKKARQAVDCSAAGGQKVSPLGKNDLRVGAAAAGC